MADRHAHAGRWFPALPSAMAAFRRLPAVPRDGLPSWLAVFDWNPPWSQHDRPDRDEAHRAGRVACLMTQTVQEHCGHRHHRLGSTTTECRVSTQSCEAESPVTRANSLKPSRTGHHGAPHQTGAFPSLNRPAARCRLGTYASVGSSTAERTLGTIAAGTSRSRPPRHGWASEGGEPLHRARSLFEPVSRPALVAVTDCRRTRRRAAVTAPGGPCPHREGDKP